jgi:hypothetical protein
MALTEATHISSSSVLSEFYFTYTHIGFTKYCTEDYEVV